MSGKWFTVTYIQVDLVLSEPVVWFLLDGDVVRPHLKFVASEVKGNSNFLVVTRRSGFEMFKRNGTYCNTIHTATLISAGTSRPLIGDHNGLS